MVEEEEKKKSSVISYEKPLIQKVWKKIQYGVQLIYIIFYLENWTGEPFCSQLKRWKEWWEYFWRVGGKKFIEKKKVCNLKGGTQ